MDLVSRSGMRQWKLFDGLTPGGQRTFERSEPEPRQ